MSMTGLRVMAGIVCIPSACRKQHPWVSTCFRDLKCPIQAFLRVCACACVLVIVVFLSPSSFFSPSPHPYCSHWDLWQRMCDQVKGQWVPIRDYMSHRTCLLFLCVFLCVCIHIMGRGSLGLKVSQLYIWFRLHNVMEWVCWLLVLIFNINNFNLSMPQMKSWKWGN
jgi:hypothetical protein